MLSRSEKKKKDTERKQKKRLRIKIAVLAAIIVCSFGWLMHWIDSSDSSAGRLVAAEPPPLTAKPSETVNDAENRPVPAIPSEPSDVMPPEEEKPAPPSMVKLSFVGDMTFAGKVEVLLKDNGFDMPYKFVSSYLQNADITVGNLETPLTMNGAPEYKEYAYQSAPENAEQLSRAGFDVVNLANNHAMDYGREGLLDTFKHLEENGIRYVGAGRNMSEAFSYTLIEKNGIRTAFLGFSRVVPFQTWYATKDLSGVAGTYSPEYAIKAIQAAREQADLVVVLAHWGEERSDYPVKEQTELAYQYIDAGADLIVGSHPHVLQGLEQYKGKWIAYSLGNFIFTTNTNSKTWETVILQAACTKERECELELVPVMTKYAQPVRMIEEEGHALFERLSEISFGAYVNKDGKVTAAPVRLDHGTEEPVQENLEIIADAAEETKKN